MRAFDEEPNSWRLSNARIWTADPDRPLASSLTVTGGRIAALDGPDDGDRPTFDLGGASVLPGLIDSHLHLVMGGEALLELDLSAVTDRAGFEQAIAARHRALPPGAWLIARGWNEDAFADRVPPDRTWLALAGNRPTVAWRMDSHACVANDAVLARLDLSTDPPGGRIVRDPGGRPTGLLQEAAAWGLVQPIVPKPGPAERRAAVRAAGAHLASLGITSVGSMEYLSVLREAIEPERESLAVRMQVTLLDREWPLDLRPALEFRGDDLLAVIGMKAFIDGTLGSRTARMLEPYADDPGNRGLLVELAERGVLLDWIRSVRAAGLSPSMHAIGDDAVRLALDVIDRSDAPGAPPARIEHAQTVHRDDLPRFRGRFASMQPLHKAYDARTATARFGPARMDRFFPFRSLLRAGARLAFGSDWPIVSADPFRAIAAAVTGLDVDGRPCRTEESISVEEALVASTREAAACLGLRRTGILRPGFAADLVALDRDPFGVDWSRERPAVLFTLLGGACSHGAFEPQGA
jgi:predicted amidohydrolase YtcJ